MNNSKIIYFTLSASFLLLMTALFSSYSNINQNTNMIEILETDQIELNYYANKLNYDLKKNQASVMQAVILKSKITGIEASNRFQEINDSVMKLEKFLKNTRYSVESLSKTLNIIKNRIAAYKAVQGSLIDAIQSNDTDDIEDALIGFSSTTTKFSQDTETLIDIANFQLYEKLVELKNNNDKSSQTTLLSFLVTLFLLAFSIFKFTILHKRVRQQLTRAESAEQKQKELQKKLLAYNDNLEKEVIKKTKEIHQKIYTHALSGLPNRNQLLEDAMRYHFKQMALLNIDKFQQFNDVYGEELGNIALKLSADFLAEQIKDDMDTLLYHIGGDEFVFCVKDIDSIDNDIFAQKIETLMQNFTRKTFHYDKQKFTFNISAGLAFSGRKKMLAYADMALKDAKKRNIHISIFHADKELEKVHKKDIERHKQLLYALENDGLVSYFQPIIPVADKSKPVKYESLIRLIARDNSVILPFNFINIAKTNRIYYRITNQVIINTLKIASKYKVPCSLNISLSDIENERSMKFLFDTISEYDYNNLLTVELLETEEIKDYKSVYEFCIKIRSFGLKIALDDFGSGYSNFSHIIHLPVDYIKIDASLISNIDRDQNSRLMAETIVELAHKLNVETIAEFVSSKEIFEVIKEIGIDYAQGYYFAKPEPIEKHLKTGLHNIN